MAIDTAANFIYSTVATPPSPATSGTSLVMTDDLSSIMAAVPFNMFVWPTAVGPLSGNAEIVRVTAISGATLTIVRTQEGTSARTIIAGDQIAEGPTAKFRDDVVTAIAAAQAAAIAASVPTTRTVNGHALSSNVTVTKSDVSLGSVTDDVQTKAAIVPNTAPSAGQLLVGNAGGTAYAPVSASGDATVASTGALTLATVNSNVSTYGSATKASVVTVNAKGLVTAASESTVTPAIGSVTGLGTGVATALAKAADGSVSDAIGFRGIPPVSTSADLTLADSHNGKKIYHPSADTTARTWTLDFSAITDPAGFTVTLINDASGGIITIAFSNGTGVLAGAGTTGSRSLAANGIATITGMTTTRAMINGTGLT